MSEGPSALDRVVYRAVFLPVRLASYLVDLVFLLTTRPRLALALLRLGASSMRRSPYQWPRREEIKRAFSSAGQSLSEALYGEIPVFAAVRLLRRANVGADSTMVDLGAGRGRMLLAACWLGATARGVELNGEHVALASLPLSEIGVELEEANAMLADVSDATHLFVSWQGLAEDTRERLTEHIRRECAPGTVIVAVKTPVEAAGFSSVFETWSLFTWGVERVYAFSLEPSSDSIADRSSPSSMGRDSRYSSSSQSAKSRVRQRSEQNGRSAPSAGTSLLQMGQRRI